MRGSFTVLCCLLWTVLLAGCGGSREDSEEVGIVDSILGSGSKTVGEDIAPADITEFFYTEENINYDAYYLRYRFYVEDGARFFSYDERKRDGEYGPATEDDRVMYGTVELSDGAWEEFLDCIDGGSVVKRTDSADSGDDGPWMYLYWNGDKGKYRQFSFESHRDQNKFEEMCRSMAEENEISTGNKYRLILEDSFFETEKTLYSPGEKVTVYYDLIATDTDYHFYSDEVDIRTSFDDRHGYVITFIMPERDVTLSVKTRNSMEYDPNAE